MINALVENSLRHRALVVMLVALAAVAGAVAYRGLRVDVFPELTLPVFTLNAENPAMAPEEMEALVTQPIESQLNGLPGATVVRSVTEQGVSVVTVQFDPNTDYWRDRQFVTERLSSILPLLPSGTEPPVLTSISTRLAEVYEFALEGDDLREARDLAEWQIRYRLMNVPGVAMVTTMGGYLRQFRVTVDPQQLQTYGLSLTDVETALQEGNENPAGGFLRRGPTEYTVRGIGRFQSVDDIANMVISEREGAPIYVRNVAEVTESHQIRRGLARRNGKECVTVTVTKQFGADTLKVVAGVKRALAELKHTFPPDVKVYPFFDQSLLINSAISGVKRAVYVGAVLVIAVVFLLLGNLRCSLIVAVSLPLSVFITGILLRQFGIGLNTMTLGGIAIAVGIMIDAAIIMTENIFHRMHEVRDGQWLMVNGSEDANYQTSTINHSESVLRAAREMGRPIAFATLIIIAVFSPLFFIGGVEGLMFGPLALTVCLSMAVSLVVALTLVPVVSNRFIKVGGEAGEVRLIQTLKRVYVPALHYAFAHSWRTRLIALLITVIAFALVPLVGKEFMPKMDEGALMVPSLMSPDTSLNESDRIGQVMDKVYLSNPSVQQVVRRTGHTEEPVGEVEPVANSETVVSFKPYHPPTDKVADKLREEVMKIRGVNAFFTQPLANRIEEGLAGTPAALSVKLFGPDLSVLAQYGQKIQNTMATIRGVADLRLDQPAGVPQLQIVLDRQKAARFGVNVAQISRVIGLGIGGKEVTQLLRNLRNYGVFVRLREDVIADPEKIGSLLVETPDGSSVPLREIARIEFAEGPNIVRREAMSRRIAIDCNVIGRDLGSVVADAQKSLQPMMRQLPKGYYLVFGGNYENVQRASRSLNLAILAALCAVFLLLFVALNSASHSAVILTSLPDAFVGGIAALLVFHETLNVSSAVGFIALFGIAVQNGLVLVTQANDLRAEGVAMEDAIRQASINRLRPKLMTASCAILGLLPILLLPGAGIEIERPLAIVMIGGLMTSTLFTLLVLPTVYVMVERWRKPRQNRSRGESA